MINPDRIGHVVLKVRNLERSRQFYSEVLGLEVMFEIPGMAFWPAIAATITKSA
jgi:catechol-2,3-dioxygenase